MRTDPLEFGITDAMVIEWAVERLANSERIAAEKRGDEQVGWLADVLCWRRIVQLLKPASLGERAAPPQREEQIQDMETRVDNRIGSPSTGSTAATNGR